MTDNDILTILKTDLQISATALDDYLAQLIFASKKYITAEGITLEDTADDGMLVEMYAAYLYRKRREDKAEMPRFLRWALNNRLITEKGGV